MDIEDIHAPDEDTDPTSQQIRTDDITTPNNTTGDSTSQPLQTDVKEVSACDVSDISNKPRLPAGSPGKRNPLSRSREEFPTLIIPTADYITYEKNLERALTYPKIERAVNPHATRNFQPN
jgi:hypothetical protein